MERPSHENSLTEEQRKHQSEVELDDYNFDFWVDNDDIEDLKLDLVS